MKKIMKKELELEHNLSADIKKIDLNELETSQ